MCWRRVSRHQKTLLIVLFYFIVYNLIYYSMLPENSFTFVRDELRVGNEYALAYLAADHRAPVFSDAEGSDAFATRHCGKCFVTNNRGFLPMSDYDAVLVHGDRALLAEPSPFMDPEKRFLIETSRRCVHNKLRDCNWEPRITSFSTKEAFDLCQLCDYLHERRSPPSH